MQGPLTKSQIDKLGQRLRAQTFQEVELTVLDEYRRSFGPAYDRVVEKVQAVLGVPVSGRPAKSTTSIIEKLNRESIRLSQIQDIAGCRVVVSDSLEQNRAVELIAKAFEGAEIQDRRPRPSMATVPSISSFVIMGNRSSYKSAPNCNRFGQRFQRSSPMSLIRR